MGDEDGLRIDAGKLHDVLDTYGIANSLEVYQGTHTSKVLTVSRIMLFPFSAKISVLRTIADNYCSDMQCGASGIET